MLRAALRWILPLTCLLILGPLAGLLTGSLIAPDGGHDATPLLCDAPLLGLLAAAGAMALATVGGAVTATQMGGSWGLASAGFVLAWAAWGTGTVDQILRRTQTGATFWTIAVEGAIVGVMGVASAVLIFAAGRWRRPGATRDPALPRPSDAALAPDLSLTALVLEEIAGMGAALLGRAREARGDEPGGAGPVALSLVVALVAGSVGAWLVAVEALKGQTFAAAAIAGLVAAAIGRVTAEGAPATLFVAVVALLSVAAPIAAAVMYPGAEGAVRAAYASNLIPVARILPLDWIAGAFVGIPIGLSWAASMTERHVPEHA